MYEDRVVEIIKNQLKINDICLDDEFFKDLGISSLDMISLLFEIEKEFGISIVLTDLVNVKTVQDLLNTLIKYFESRQDRKKF